jgi:electron-transferring-flavoprotein dehydrogenase
MTGIERWLLPRIGVKRPPWTIHRNSPTMMLPAGGPAPIVYHPAGQQADL